MEDLERRRDARRRTRGIGAAAVAFVVAAFGAIVLYGAFHHPPETPRQTARSPNPRVGPPSPQAAKQSPPPASTLQFIDPEHGWMVVHGHIVQTTDGGKTWSEQTGTSGAKLLQFVDATHGWAASETELWRTTDGGSHWESLGDEVLTSFQFLTDKEGWAVEGGHEESVGLLVKTDDGGKTWASQDLQANSVCFGDRSGWATGPSAGGVALQQTVDTGGDWTETTVPLPNADQVPYTATLSCSGNQAWLVVTGDAGAGHVAYAVFRAEGSGEAKAVVQDGFTHPLGDQKGVFQSTDPQPGPFASVGGSNGKFVTWCPPCGPTSAINLTEDAGTSWERSEFPQSAQDEPVGLSFIDENQGWAAFSAVLPNAGGQTSNVFLFATSDGGKTWSQRGVYRSAP